MTTTVGTLSIEDRLSIQELIARYNFYVDTRQLEPLLSLFVADDPVFDETRLGSPRVSGLENLREFFSKDVFDVIEGQAHLTGGYLIEEVTEKGARGVCTIFYDGDVKGGGTIHVTGYYEDVYERTSEGWKFRSRTVIPYTKPQVSGQTPTADGT